MLPYLQEVQNKSKKYSVVFKGINYGENTQDGEFAETHNLSTDKYPCITQRPARLWEANYNKPTTIHAKGQLLVIDGTDVFYGNEKVGTVKEGKKQVETVGNYIVIFPDKKYYKVPTEDENGVMQPGEFGSMEITYEKDRLKFTSSSISVLREYTHRATTTGQVAIAFFPSAVQFPEGNLWFKEGDEITISGCSQEGLNQTLTVLSATKTSLYFAGTPFANVIGNSSYTYEYSAVTITIPLKEEDYFPFRKGDAVSISGCSENGNNKKEQIIIRGKTNDTLTFDDNAFTAVDVESNTVTIKRTVPDLNFICESNYRLWGTKGNKIYSSAYSDPLNFQLFENLSSDSYEIEVGSEGEFTGCIPFSTYICFFKENTLHKLYGSKPSNFSVTEANIYGVQSGSERSMQIVNEQLIYKGVGGVYAYTGGVPELISEKFGNKRYSDAVACCDGEIYYISMKNGDKWDMFTYDVHKNIWLREDDTQAVDMTFYDGKVYYIDSDGGLYYIDKTADRSDIEWSATFCTMHETVNERKGYSKFHLRLDMDAKAWIAVDIKTDRDLQWKQVHTSHNEKAKTISIPIKPTRCDSIDIRLRGKGKCTVKAFVREFTVGSDV